MDYLTNLYNIDYQSKLQQLQQVGIRILRPLSPNKGKVLDFVKTNFSQQWADEVSTAFCTSPAHCFVAVKGNKIVGFAGYNCTAKGYFGPLGVVRSVRSKGIGSELLYQCLMSMKSQGYGYAIIGSVNDKAVTLYQRVCNAQPIAGSDKSLYDDLI